MNTNENTACTSWSGATEGVQEVEGGGDGDNFAFLADGESSSDDMIFHLYNSILLKNLNLKENHVYLFLHKLQHKSVSQRELGKINGNAKRHFFSLQVKIVFIFLKIIHQ